VSAGRVILLVEDNPLDVDLTRRAFARTHSEVAIEVARDGEEALAFIPRWQAGAALPLVILLDLNLPRATGLEVLRCLKANPVSRVIPVVTVSTSVAPEDIQAAYASGANSYLVKPVEFDRFVEAASLLMAYWTKLNEPPS
jgi:CheY-like chemotaxis protein